MLFSDIPAWVTDLRGVGETIVAILAAITAFWKLAMKPFLAKLEAERNEDFDRRLELRIHPVEDKLSELSTQTNTKLDVMTGRIDRFSDSLTATRVQLGKVEGAIDQQTKSNTILIEQQRLLAVDVRAHTETEGAP